MVVTPENFIIQSLLTVSQSDIHKNRNVLIESVCTLYTGNAPVDSYQTNDTHCNDNTEI